jgi:peptide/nickel transport system permease protein
LNALRTEVRQPSRGGQSRELTYRLRRLGLGTVTRWAVLVFLGGVVVLVVLPVVLPASPTSLDPAHGLNPPSSSHWFGTDQVGRDVGARVLYGARLSLTVASVTALSVLVVGSILGAIAAASPRYLGEAIMRTLDVMLAFPGILLAIVLAAVIGPSLGTTIIVLVVVYSPSMARVVRSAVLSEYGEDYVVAARLVGSSRIRIVGFHIGVNAAPPIIVYTTLILADAIIAEAALSFLGAGLKPPAPSWGNILRDGQASMNAGAWWISLFPGIAIMLTVLVLNRFSETIDRQMRW